MVRSASQGSWQSALHFLERRFPARWSPRLDLTVDHGLDAEDELDAKYPTTEALDEAIADLQRQALSKLTPADLAALAEAEIERRKERSS
jgi:hypothetical protein